MITTNLTVSDPTAPFGAGGNSASGTPVNGGKGWGRGRRHVCRTGPDGEKKCELVYYRGENSRNPKNYNAATDGDLWFDNATDCGDNCFNWNSLNRNYPQGTIAGDAQREFNYLRRISNAPISNNDGPAIAIPQGNIRATGEAQEYRLIRGFDAKYKFKMNVQRQGTYGTSGEALALSALFLPGFRAGVGMATYGFTVIDVRFSLRAQAVGDVFCRCVELCSEYEPDLVFKDIERATGPVKGGEEGEYETVLNGFSINCCGECQGPGNLDDKVGRGRFSAIKRFYFPGTYRDEKGFAADKPVMYLKIIKSLFDTLQVTGEDGTKQPLQYISDAVADWLDTKNCTFCGDDGGVILA